MKNTIGFYLSKHIDLLDGHYKRYGLILFALMFVGMLLEMLGIGMIIPVLALIAEGDQMTGYPAFQSAMSMFGDYGYSQKIIFGVLALALVYLIKTIYLGFLAWFQAKYIYGLQAWLSAKLFEGYVNQPYVFHLQHNSAQLIRNVISEVAILASVTQSQMMLVGEVLVLFGIATLLMIIEPFGTISIAVFLGLSSWLFYAITKKHILKWGELRQYHEGLRMMHLKHGLDGVKDVKLMGREDEFFRHYKLHNNESASAMQLQTALQQLPRLWLEMLAVFGIALLVSVMTLQNSTLEGILPTVGVFAAAAFRLLPSINRLLSSLQSIRYAQPVIEMVHSEMSHLESVQPRKDLKKFKFEKQIEMNDISFTYPDETKPTLYDVSFNVYRNTTVGIIGESGSGKSTLVDIVLGLLDHQSGEIYVDGIDRNEILHSWQKQIGYVPQTIFLTDDTLMHNIAFGIPDDQINSNDVWNAVCLAQLDKFVGEQREGLNAVVGERGIRLSGGQRQRIGIARALYNNPSILVLDEATSSLDVPTEKAVMKAINELHHEKTIIIVAHRLSTVEECDYIYRLSDGKVIEKGCASDVLNATNPIN